MIICVKPASREEIPIHFCFSRISRGWSLPLSQLFQKIESEHLVVRTSRRDIRLRRKKSTEEGEFPSTEFIE